MGLVGCRATAVDTFSAGAAGHIDGIDVAVEHDAVEADDPDVIEHAAIGQHGLELAIRLHAAERALDGLVDFRDVEGALLDGDEVLGVLAVEVVLAGGALRVVLVDGRLQRSGI